MSEGYHIEDEVQRRSYDSDLMRRLLAYLRPYKGIMTVATFFLLLAALLSSVTPWLNWKAISWYINNPERVAIGKQISDASGASSVELDHALAEQAARDRSDLQVLILIVMLLLLGEALSRYFQMLIVAIVGERAMLRMRMDVFEHLQRMSLRFLDRNPVGRLMTRVTSDVEKIQETIVSGVVQIINDLVVFLVVLGFMVYNNWQLTLVTLSPLPLVFVTGVVFRRYAQHSYLEIRRKIARLNAYMQENISGMRVVQVFCREDANYDEYKARNADHRDEWLRQIRNYAYYFPVIDFLGTLSIALIILFGGRQLLHLQHLLDSPADIGMFFAYVQWSERLYGPIRALADRYNLILEAMASSERIFELMDTPEEIANKPDAIKPQAFRGAVEFKDVWFAYEPGQWVLKGINLSIRPGERVAIVGHTGAGKSTFINLLSRFYDVQRGSITIDGVDVRDYDKDALRRNIGVVLQDVFLFSGSIDHNIRLGNREMDAERVRSCAEYVNAAAFIERLSERYDYNVGERGCNLSTGQRQLIAFARTLAHDPRILVLDEATSSIDPETEALIQDAIGKLMEGRTSIVIAHRLSTIQHAERIVVMHHGEIREMGTHQELLAQRGIYYRLYQLQYRNQSGKR
jgi:ATP-binding cassette subfamily B protein